MAHNDKKYKIKQKNIIISFFILISLAGIIYSSINLIIWTFDNNETNSEINDINEKVIVNEVNETEEIEITAQEETPNDFNPYWDYIKMKLIDIDFTELKNINPDVKGWIQLEGTNINYPFVQGNDNKYYLSHSFYKNNNRAGWIFLDYRNTDITTDKNTIIYGHDIKTGSMFGSLKNTLETSWQNNTNNHIVKMSTEKENSLWQVFSVYTIPATSDYLQVKFNDTEFVNFIKTISDRSIYDFNTSIGKNDKILTLSSCYINSDSRVVLHAKLIKYQKNNIN